MYHEGMTPQFKVTIDQDKRIGASFIEAVAVSRVANEAVDDGVAFLRSVLLRERGARVHVA